MQGWLILFCSDKLREAKSLNLTFNKEIHFFNREKIMCFY
jgi:hypothetical protein